MKKVKSSALIFSVMSCAETVNTSNYANAEKYISNRGDLALCARQQGLDAPYQFKEQYNRDSDTITYIFTKAVNGSSERFAAAQSCAEKRFQSRGRTDFPQTTAAECQATFDVLKSSTANNGSDTYIYNSYGTNSSVDSAASTAAAVLLFGIAGLIIAEGSVVQTYKNCMKRVTGNDNVTPLRASGTPTSANAGVAASTVGAPKAKPQSGGSPMIATNPRPVLNGSGKVAPAKSATAPATAPAKIENTTETQSGYTSPQTAPVSTGVNPECPAGASLFTGGAGLCPQ